MSITPFKIHIPDEELDLLNRKLELARLPTYITNAHWGEENGVGVKLISDTLDFWRTKYSWREEEAKLNKLPQFKTPIDVDGFGTFDIHFVHSKTSKANGIPLIFLHGWPGSFAEVEKILPILNDSGFDVVAPSLPGYGFSSYTDKRDFKLNHMAEIMHKLMQKLGHKEYVVQGGDWGHWVVRVMAIMYPENVKAMHVNMLYINPPDFKDGEPKYTPYEQKSIERYRWFMDTNSDYNKIQSTKPRNLSFGLHDSPVGMLAWMTDKLFLWADNYPWTPSELITWTLLHWFPGPVTAIVLYHNNPPSENAHTGLVAKNVVKIPTGLSTFPKELSPVPRSWAETAVNLQFFTEHESGGHFAAYERPKELSDDMIKFFKQFWKA
ncbi:uncharacterized protein KY384_003410 [Bacidia gigantensis]|uniref:uncharacterized protein n=1 Tax=Bacidia gigantensis TaxID=2732470 RepID=UPI001D05B946|nr:uncharacterized protein KY384_003410 [Bacidia gigantensis]KAG8531774.1 hypothetical protein KY384_003410 [Bacidia gigantensis]